MDDTMPVKTRAVPGHIILRAGGRGVTLRADEAEQVAAEIIRYIASIRGDE